MTLENMKEKAMEMLENDNDLFCAMVDELDSWNGFADGFRCYYMSEIDDFCAGMKVSDFLDSLTGDFCKNDEYFYYSIYGLESTDDKSELYHDNVSSDELLDEIIGKYNHLYFYDSEFEELIDSIVNYDEEDEKETAAA